MKGLEMVVLEIVSGEKSRSFWESINNINAMSTGDDIHQVLYFMGCKMQELESEIETLKAKLEEQEKRL